MSDRNKPLISVVIPTYKCRGGLKRAIESVLCQTYSNFEIIVVDDNTAGDEYRIQTEIIMNGYIRNSKINYIKHSHNRNGAAARNTGINAAKGEYIAFLDDDDEWLPEKLDKQLLYIKEHPEHDCVYCLARHGDKPEPTIPYEGNAIVPMLTNRTKMYTPTLLFTKRSLSTIGGFNEGFVRHQDYELLVKFFENGYTIGCKKEILVIIHSAGGNNLSIKKHIELKEQFLETFSKTIEKLDIERSGLKNKIIACNYAVIVDSAIANKKLKPALVLSLKYFPINPTSFITQLVLLAKDHLLRKF